MLLTGPAHAAASLSGSYTNASCVAGCSSPCGSLTNGQSCTAYSASSVPCGSSCAGETRTCSNGTLSGSYTATSCSVAACASCSSPCGTIAHGASCTAYAASSVACGSSCSSQTRTCNNGTLSGSYAYASCSVGACGCSSPCGTIANGATCTAYAAPSVACGGSCTSQVQTCSNGTLSPSSYAYGQLLGRCVCGCAASGVCGASAHGTVCYTWPNQTISWINCYCNGKNCSTTEDSATCTNGTWVGTIGAYTGCGCATACFLGETRITMADGSTKRMDDLEVGDMVKGRAHANKVLFIPTHDTNGHIYGFNGGKPFVTGGHPFWTRDGWKAIDPKLTPKEHHNVKTTQLHVGDVLILSTGEPLVLTSIDTSDEIGTHHVFNPGVDGDHTYYANGYLVHNKVANCP